MKNRKNITNNKRVIDEPSNNLKHFFACGFNFQIADHDLISNYHINVSNQYGVINFKDQNLWDYISIDFAKFEIKHFDKLNNNI